MSSVAGLVVIALLVRLGGVAVVDHYTDATKILFDMHGSAGEYAEIARHIVAGEGFCLLTFDGKAIPSAYMPPAQAYLLAGTFMLLGEGLVSLLLMQVLYSILGAITCWVIYRLGELLLGRTAGLLAGYGYALYPSSVFMC